jgi:hypothetical protein
MWLRFCVLPTLVAAAASNYVGYLISTFSDVNPTVQLHLSNGNNPSSFTFLNKGKAVLRSHLGEKAVRDCFLAYNSARTQWYMLATGECWNDTFIIAQRQTHVRLSNIDLDVKAKGFSWDRATRKGSRSIIVWKSRNLVDWSPANSLK